jgi:hypothetical protein
MKQEPGRSKMGGDRKLRRGAAGVISIPSDDSTFITMMKRE